MEKCPCCNGNGKWGNMPKHLMPANYRDQNIYFPCSWCKGTGKKSEVDMEKLERRQAILKQAAEMTAKANERNN
jgi:hypothetical protein